jgi:threonine/homoserine/homoserine lactone efflux protein
MAATPGPNNAMLAASGMNFGVRRTVPHILGIAIGLMVLLFVCGLGFGVLIQTVAYAELSLAIIGSAYLVYLAWRVANAGAPMVADGGRPLSFIESFGFQFLNPKGWVMGITAATLMPSLGDPTQTILVLSILGGIVGTPSMAIWTVFGAGLARVFQNVKARRRINGALAVLLLATIPFMFR